MLHPGHCSYSKTISLTIVISLILGLVALCSVLGIEYFTTVTKVQKQQDDGETYSFSSSSNPNKNYMPADGYPRLLITSPCSGSSITIRFSKKILEAHGYSVFVGDEPGVPSRNHFYAAAKANLELKLDREPTPREIVVESFKLYNAKAFSKNKILLIKINHIWGDTGKELTEMGAKFAYALRSNILDRAICVVRDCFQKEKFGHQVYANGTVSDSCFGRRKSHDKIQAYIDDVDALVDYMTRRQSDDERRIRNYKTYIVPPAEIQSYEDLFHFEYTKSQVVFEQSVKAWCKLLGNFITVDEGIVREVLRPYQDSLPPLPPHSELVYNYNYVWQTIQDKYSSWMPYIRQEGES